MKGVGILVLGWALLPAPSGAAQIYRCPGSQGVPQFQHVPCEEGEAVQLQPPAAHWEPLREGERRMLAQPRREARPATKRRSSSSGKERASGRVCLGKRQRVEAISARLRRGYKPAQGEKLRRRRAELVEFLRLYCE